MTNKQLVLKFYPYARLITVKHDDGDVLYYVQHGGDEPRLYTFAQLSSAKAWAHVAREIKSRKP